MGLVIHDLACVSCGREDYDAAVDTCSLPFCPCGGAMEIRWDISRRRAPVTLQAAVHGSERAVVWRNPQTGSTAYPPMNNVPMPERYARGGYERVELDSLQKLDTFCKTQNVSNEKANFNSGNGL